MKPGALPGDWKPNFSNSPGPDLGAKHHIGNPLQIYPLYENGFRASRKQSVVDNHKESADASHHHIAEPWAHLTDFDLYSCMKTLRESPKPISTLGTMAHLQKRLRASERQARRIE